MRQDFFEYTPQFKLIVAGNHKPGLRNVDEAIRRRLHLVPFTVTIGEEERDPDLGECRPWPFARVFAEKPVMCVSEMRFGPSTKTLHQCTAFQANHTVISQVGCRGRILTAAFQISRGYLQGQLLCLLRPASSGSLLSNG